MRRIAMPDQFKLSFKRGLELGPANNLREQLVSDHNCRRNCDDGQKHMMVMWCLKH